MKNFKKIALGLAVMLIAFGFSAFTSTNNSTNTYWSFDSNDLSDARNHLMYTLINNPSTPACEDDTPMLPCVLELGPEVIDRDALELHFDDAIKYPTDQSVFDIAVRKKNIETK